MSEAGFESCEFEASQLMSFSLGIAPGRLNFIFNDEISPGEAEAFDLAVKRRLTHEPLQYILGEWDFYSKTFKVGKGVLIPRPETEGLVDICLEKLRYIDSPVIIDLCAGSGCIAITLARLLPSSRVFAVEKYDDALFYLNKNISFFSLNNVKAVKGDIFDSSLALSLPKADAVVSNPPYISSEDIPLLQKEVKCEPRTALDGGSDGIDFYRAIRSNFSVNPGGFFAFECGENQSGLICDLFDAYPNKQVYRDIYGVERFVFVERLSE
ncbi:MAG: peptide chain release factor N(5)-glutamine methyltransferase [Clostridiales bacterium]|nr:peptide chain release factor N(5)-glutamine methyltransferase [Clostridiales bacterium]